MNHLVQNFRYRPEVDGLRGVAVLAVVLFHAGLGLSGGYIGVDVFFVISGYLITSLIVFELQQGKFKLANFWERRARRIIPALVVVVLATLIAGWFLFLPREYTELGKSATSLSVFGANIYFWITNWSGYFAITAEEMPLLHTWSLAVEEQFYLIAPLVLSAVYGFPGLRTNRVFLGLVGIAALISFLTSVYGVARHPVAAFYLLPTRAWELLLGSALAVCPTSWMTKQRTIRESTSYLGLVCILIPCFVYSGETSFPGLAALPPCLGTALILWNSNSIATDITPTSLCRLLTARPIVFIGLISYSLYLYHWPIFAFSRYYLVHEPVGLGQRITMVAMSLALAIISWRLIETPFRRKTLCFSQKSIYLFAFSALIATFLAGFGVYASRGLSQRMPHDIGVALDPKDYFIRDLTTEDIVAGRLVPFGTLNAHHPVKVVVWGDSHATAALPAFDAVLKTRGLSGVAATHSATAPVLRYFMENRYGLGKNAVRFNEEVITYIQKHQVPNVVLIACWSGYDSGVQSALLDTVRKIVSVGARPWVFLQVPSHPYDVSTLCRHFWGPLPTLNQNRFCAKPGLSNGTNFGGPDFLDQIRNAGGRIIDPRPAFLNASGELYLISLDGVILYSDREHLTKLGAEKILVPVLERSWLPYL